MSFEWQISPLIKFHKFGRRGLANDLLKLINYKNSMASDHCTLRQFRQFLVLADKLHFGRAADELSMSQPPLSANLRQLEFSLGIQLMERTTKSVRLTPAGAVFAQKIGHVLGHISAAEEAAKRVARAEAEKMSIAFVPSLALSACWPMLLKSFFQNCPAIDLCLEEMNSTRQLDQLNQHHIDIGFVHNISLPEEISSVHLLSERFVCCVPSQHRLAGRASITLDELSGDSILVFLRDLAPTYHDRISALMHVAGLEPCLQYRLHHWSTIVALVGCGAGVSIIPESLVRAGASNVSYINLSMPSAFYGISMVWRKNDDRDALRCFVEKVSSIIRLQAP